MKRTFKAGEILDSLWAVCLERAGGDEAKAVKWDGMGDEIAERSVLRGNDEFKALYDMVFAADGKHWLIRYEANERDGATTLIEYGSRRVPPWDYPDQKFEAQEVREVTRSVTVWEVVP